MGRLRRTTRRNKPVDFPAFSMHGIPSSVEVLFAEPTRDYRVLACVSVEQTRGLGCAVIENVMTAARIVRADAVFIGGRPKVENLRCGPLRAYFLRWAPEIFEFPED
jgi:hypothetical protein